MSEIVPLYGTLPPDGLIDELTANVSYSETEECLTMAFQVVPKKGYVEPTIRLVMGLFPGMLEQIRRIDNDGNEGRSAMAHEAEVPPLPT